VDYVHVVFTLPHALNRLARLRPRLVYDGLFRAAAGTLLEFGRDPRHLGAEPGILAVLHTWGQNLSLHIHLHCIVTAGGLDATHRRWIRGKGGYLFPVRALSVVFRGKYLDGLWAALAADPTLLACVNRTDLYRQPWVVYAKRPYAGPRRVLDYLARYTHRVALTNDRLLGLDDHGLVHLRWRDYARGGKRSVLRLAPTELLRRFLLHVLPRGFQRVRHYGLLGRRHKAAKLAACRRYFGTRTDAASATCAAAIARACLGLDPHRCLACGSVQLRREPVAPVLRTLTQPTDRGYSIPHARAPTAGAS
jgi:hypothetical protein